MLPESPSFYTATATSVLQVVGEFENEMENKYINVMLKSIVVISLLCRGTSKE